MEWTKNLVKLDKPTKEVNLVDGKVRKVKQDKLGRLYIWIE